MKEQYESIIRMCQELLDKGPVDPTLGICHSLRQRNGQGYYKAASLLEGIVETWPKFSGSSAYPIPGDGTDCTDPSDCFNRVVDLWEGKQGELRHDLLHFIVKHCERKILDLSFPERDIGPFRALLVE